MERFHHGIKAKPPEGWDLMGRCLGHANVSGMLVAQRFYREQRQTIPAMPSQLAKAQNVTTYTFKPRSFRIVCHIEIESNALVLQGTMSRSSSWFCGCYFSVSFDDLPLLPFAGLSLSLSL